jgi:hypothetical protein
MGMRVYEAGDDTSASETDLLVYLRRVQALDDVIFSPDPFYETIPDE